MDIRQLVRLPNGRYVARISLAMILRSLWHILNGSRLRRHLEWRRAMKAAEAEHKRRSDGAKKGWQTRRRNAEVTRALDEFDAQREIEGVPV